MPDETTNGSSSPAQTPAPAPPTQPSAPPPTQPSQRVAVLTGIWKRLTQVFTLPVQPQSSALAPVSAGASVPSTQELAEQIQTIALTSDTPIETIVAMLAGETAEVTEVIQSLDDNKEHVLGRIVKAAATILCYTLPWIIAYYAGSALGYTYSGGVAFNLTHTSSAYYYLVSWAYEFGLVFLMIAMVVQFKRVKGRHGLPAMIALLALFLVLSITSASAQWILFESHINVHDSSQVIGALFRTLGTPLTDLTGAVVLAVIHIKTLEQQLATMQQKTDASIAINKKKLANKLEVIQAAMDVKSILQKEEDYRAKNELANTIISLFSENAIETIRQSLERRQDTGGSYRRDGYR